MAHAKLNSMFTSINGRVGNIVFYRRGSIQCLRRYVIPRNPDTEAQRANRHTFRDAVSSWKMLTKDEQYRYNRKVIKLKLTMSGYNLYISEYMKKERINDTTTEPVCIEERYGTDSDPLRSSYRSTPYMIRNRYYIAYNSPAFSPGQG